MSSDLSLPARVRRTLTTAGRTLTGGRPGLSACVVGAAAGTAALQSSGVDGWWAVPLVTIALLTSRVRRGR